MVQPYDDSQDSYDIITAEENSARARVRYLGIEILKLYNTVSKFFFCGLAVYYMLFPAKLRRFIRFLKASLNKINAQC